MTNTEGRAIFITNTPWTWQTRTTTIRKVRNDTAQPKSDRFDVLSEIVWSSFNSPIFRLHSNGPRAIDYIQKDGKREFVFTGPDARSYIWRLYDNVSLELNDGSETPVAHFHGSSWSTGGTVIEPCLEIFAVGEHIVDIIVTTFVYVEKLKRLERKATSYPTRGHAGNGI
ncbi:hypothetical protein SERLA73DRAFT_142418 [Serpula lacrymans var. lacrymans S7.3]|uniref:DUF6593 domain-containing protein n=2 Tax=Serpula lacrymans var. lacrymans TaxID=341189 RepID=F8Q7R8_SERL3|nr:uncharacterized protein SERLADRAFT_398497 [Serpula lacrymans var. lacrymans S7.9]EGN95606.1 hypothetical protein SERLA73DRAFT_142418 [Serpula lacrymans var. lacrymans S7.3]EGO21137.1 hypothetical protein SERLADRAFT_398497 [Serpula lacrymans var. lacrymans S7.9]